MDNGEGRTHEDAESGQENVPNWYFDLPGGAWERQEEKNRNLRERVLGNIQEDAEKTKADPFARKFELKPGDADPPKFELRRPEPEQKKGGFLGLGRKKPAGDSRVASEAGDSAAVSEDEGDWSTEPPLTLQAPGGTETGLPPLRTRPSSERPEPEPTFDAVEPTPAGDEDFAARMRAWAQRAASAGAGTSEPDASAETETAEQQSEISEDAGADQSRRMPDTAIPVGTTTSTQLSAPMTTAPEGTKASLPAEQGEDVSREGMSFDSMREWAERGRDEVHPHFTTAHHEPAEEEEAVLPTPIPLRPRVHDEGEDDGLASLFVADGPDDVSAAEVDPPRMSPLVLRPRNEPELPPPPIIHEAAPERSKWDDFFNIGDTGDGDADGGELEAEGLSAMRAWAQKRPEQESGDEVPEEFLKPFDWELQEDGVRSEAQNQQNLELVKATGWGPEDEAEAERASAQATTWEEAAPFLKSDETTEEVNAVAGLPAAAVNELQPGETAPEEDDALAGLFEEARAAALHSQGERARGGRFGRLFGRKKTDVPGTEISSGEGDWVLPEGAKGAALPAITKDWVEVEPEQAAAHVAPVKPEAEFEWEPEPVETPPAASLPAVVAWAEEAPVDAADTVVLFRGEEEESWDPEPISEPAWLTAPAPWEGEQGIAETPENAVAAVDAVVAEPAAETPWWEQQAEETPAAETPVEAVASVDAVVDAPVAEAPWWEQQAEEAPAAEAHVEAVASVDAVVEEPVAETPWWEKEAEETPAAEPPVEAVASVDAVGEEPVAEAPWWEREPEETLAAETPVEAVASVDAVVEEPVAETPWWEQQAEETPAAEAHVEAVASVGAVVDEPVAETPWWERQPEETPAAETPVEAVASVDAVVEEPIAETPWWEQQPEETPPAETPVEAVASVDAVVEEPVAEAPWWEQRPAEALVVETGVEAVAAADTVIEEGVPETASWEQPAEARPVVGMRVEAVAPVDAFSEVPEPELEEERGSPSQPTALAETPTGRASGATEPDPTSEDDDDPWADFVAGSTEGRTAPPAIAPGFSTAWTGSPGPNRDDDMWGHVAATAEAGIAPEDDAIDLAASLEDQMAEARAAAQKWPGHSEASQGWSNEPAGDDSAFVADDEEDVILAAFERHAATPDTNVPVDDGALADLLGERADEIVASALDEGTGEKSFLRLTGWAPQRTSEYYDDGWVDEDAQRPGYGGTDGAGFAPPPWAAEELEADEAATPRGHHRTRTWIREIVETSLLALLVFLSVRASFQNFKVEGSSMYPTLEDGEFLIVNKLVYSEVDMEKLSNFLPFVDAGSDPKRSVFHGPERGDIVVMIDPRDKNTDLIKRVIGLPGETIEIVDGKVYINDYLLEEPYIKQAWNDSKPKITIPPGEYFVMGDNRENSLDSRSSQVGLVPKDLIIGKAMVSYWPTSKFGFAPNESGTLADAKPTLTTRRIGED